MSEVRKILEKLYKELNEEDNNKKFKEGDLVHYNSTSGSEYNCFGKFVGTTKNGKIIIDAICKANGESNVSEVTNEDGQIIDYAVRSGKDILKKRIKYLEANLNNLKKLQGEL